jgi:hypothetical protein
MSGLKKSMKQLPGEADKTTPDQKWTTKLPGRAFTADFTIA